MMSESEVLAWLAQPGVGKVCGFFSAGQFDAAKPLSITTPPIAPRWRRWLLTSLALLSLKPLLTACQTATSATASSTITGQTSTSQGQVTIRGRVLDGSTGQGVAGAEIFIGDTPYGAVADAQGNFSFTMSQQWAPVQHDSIALRIQGRPFAFLSQTINVQVLPVPSPLVIHLQRQSEGIVGKTKLHEPPKQPPVK